jgi:hypothetical protein
MSYYQEDTSYYRYSVPTRYEGTSYYYHDTSAHLIDASQYSFSVPAHYNDDTHFEPAHSDNSNVTTWSPPLSSSIEHAHELEAYAEAATNRRTYTWDDIHPAYRDCPSDSYCELVQPPADDNEYYDDITDEELAEINCRCIEHQKQMMEGKVEEIVENASEDVGDGDDDDDETGTVKVEKGENWEDHEDKDDNDGEDGDHPQPLHILAHPQPTPPSHDISDSNTVTTPPPDILAPRPFPPSPNISVQRPQLYSHPLRNQNPPDILAPEPLPWKPNIPHTSPAVSEIVWVAGTPLI